jgi:CheY-like chemotaxis protein
MPDTQKRVASSLKSTNRKQVEVEMQKIHNNLAYREDSQRQASGLIYSTVGLTDRLNEGTETILIVDDEEIILDIVARMLERMNYIALKAVSGMAAIDIYKEKLEAIDLIILDIIMPKMNGTETYEKIKEINPNAKVLFASGYCIEGDVAEKLKIGCNGFIKKPFSMRNLSEKLRELLAPTTQLGFPQTNIPSKLCSI